MNNQILIKTIAIAFAAIIVVLLGVLAFVPSAKSPTGATSPEGTVEGSVMLGPTCPVERIPPDPACAPRPYQTRITVYQKNGTTVAAMGAPGENGFYKIVL